VFGATVELEEVGRRPGQVPDLATTRPPSKPGDPESSPIAEALIAERGDVAEVARRRPAAYEVIGRPSYEAG